MLRLLMVYACLAILACAHAALAQEEAPAILENSAPPGFVLRYELSFPAYVGVNATDTPGCTPQILHATMEQWSAEHGSRWDKDEYLVQWYEQEGLPPDDSILTRSLVTWYLLNSDDPELLADLIDATRNIEFCKLTDVSPLKYYYAQKFPEYYSAPHTVSVDGVARNFPWDCTWEQQERLFDRVKSRRGKHVPEWSAGDLTWLVGPDCPTTAFRVELDEADNLIFTTIATDPLVPEIELPEVFGVTIPQQHSMDTDEEALSYLISHIRRHYLPEGEKEPDGASWVQPDAFEVRVPLLPEETWQAALRGDIPGEVDPATRLLMTARSDELKKIFEDWLLTHPELRDEIGLTRTGYADEEWHIFDLEKRDHMPLAFVGIVYTGRQDIKDELLALMRESQDVHEPMLCECSVPRLQRDWPPTV